MCEGWYDMTESRHHETQKSQCSNNFLTWKTNNFLIMGFDSKDTLY